MANEVRIVISGKDEFSRHADAAARSAGGLGTTLGNVAKVAAVATTAVGVGLVGALGASVKAAADFEQSLANTGAATGATTEQIKAMREEALKIGKDTSKSASDAADAMGELVKAGISVTDTVGGVARTTVQLAEATGASVQDMATLVSTSLNTFKIGADGATNAANVLAKAANASAIDIHDMQMSLAAGGLVAQQAGLSIDQFATAIGIMGNQGLRASDAGTSLKAMLAGLTPASDKAAASMKDLGFSAFDTAGNFKPFPQILADLDKAFGGLTEQERAQNAELLFGSDGIRAFNALIPEHKAGLDTATQQWGKFTDEMAKAPSIADQSKARLQTLNGQIEQFKGSVETLAITVGTKMLPFLTDLATKATEWVNKLLTADWSGVQSKVDDLMGGFEAVRAKAETAVAFVVEHWPEIQTKVEEVGDVLGKVFDATFKEFRDEQDKTVKWFNDHWGELETIAQEVQDGLKRIWSQSGPDIKEHLGGALAWASSALDNFADGAGLVLGSLLSFLTGDWSAGWDQASAAVGEFLNGWQKVIIAFEKAKLALGYFIDETVWGILKDVGSGAWDVLTKAAGWFWDRLKQIKGLLDDILDTATHPINFNFSISGPLDKLDDLFHRRSPSMFEQAVAGVNDGFREMAQVLAGLGPAMSGDNSIFEMETKLREMRVHIAELRVQIAQAPPKSDLIKQLRDEAQDASAAAQELQANIAALRHAASGAGGVGAAGGFLGAGAASAQRAQLSPVIGAGGTSLFDALTKALVGDESEGAALSGALDKFIENVQKALGPKAQEFGEYLRREMLTALGTDDPEAKATAIEHILNLLGAIQTQISDAADAAGKFSAERFATAYADVLGGQGTQALIGSQAATMLDTLAKAFEKGTAGNIKAAAEAAAKIREHITQALPPEVAGPMVERFNAALETFIREQTPEAAQALKDVLAEAWSAEKMQPVLNGIRDLLKKLPESAQPAFTALRDTLVNSGLDMNEVLERLKRAVDLLPSGFSEATPAIQAQILLWIQGAAEAGDAWEAAGVQIKDAMEKAAAAAKAAAAQTMGAILTLGQTVTQTNQQGGITAGSQAIYGPDGTIVGYINSTSDSYGSFTSINPTADTLAKYGGNLQAAKDDIAKQLAGAQNKHATGGLLSEPVFGVGLRSGQSYALAENGPEWVTPHGGAGGITINLYGDVYGDQGVNGLKRMIERTVRDGVRQGRFSGVLG